METERRDVGDSVAIKNTSRLKSRVIEEAKRFIVMFLYLWVIFFLFQLYNSIIISEYHITLSSHTLAVINALVFAKVMLVAEDLRLGRRFERKAVIYSVAVKSLLFAAVFIFFHLAEKIIGGMLVGKTIAQSLPMVATAGLKGLLILAAIVTIALVPFFAYSEIARIIGPDELRRLVLHARQEAESVPISHDRPDRA